MAKTVKAHLKCRHDTAANWTAKNPVLIDGELGVETDTTFFKIGDGATAWTSLKYVTSKSAVYADTATKATQDASGNVITTTYATKLELNNKQDKLTFDDTPTVDSLNPVTSDGVKTYIDNINSTLDMAISKKADSTDIVQSDWNITDASDKGYIKNKPNTWLTTNLSRPTATNDIPDYTMRSMISTVRANRLAFLPADQIIIEKTIDGGVTWADAGFSDVHKASLFSENRNFALEIPQIDGKENALCGLRVTITAMKYNVPDGTAETDKYNYWNKTYVKNTERYCALDELYIWCSSSPNRIKVKVELATGDNPNNWVTAFLDDTFGMIGGMGGNCIRIADDYNYRFFGGDTVQTFNYWNYRLTFMATSNKLDDNITINPESTQSIISIYGYGEKMWVKPNGLAYNDHLYTWDSSQNATFPANINATGKVLENGKSITDMVNNIASTYATKDYVTRAIKEALAAATITDDSKVTYKG